jgi:hypothetical protein
MSQSKNLSEIINALSSDELSTIVLKQLGLKVDKLIEPGDRQESDFLCYYNNETFLIEAKIRQDDQKEVAKREETLSKGEVYQKNDTLGRNRNISGKLKTARNQIISSSEFHKHDLRIVFHFSRGINPKAKCEQAKDTLMGRTEIFNMKDSTCKPCYFFRTSDFYIYRDAFDAAIVGYVDGSGSMNLTIFLNPYSPRYEEAKKSEFLKQHRALDPIAEEAEGKAYMPDEGLNVRKSQDILDNLYKKYDNKMIQQLDFMAPEISIRVKEE